MVHEVSFLIGGSNRDFFKTVFQRVAEKFTNNHNFNIIEADITSDMFANTEIRVDIKTSLRKHTVFVCQTEENTNNFSVNDYLWQLNLMIDACRRSHADQIIVIVPSFFYARQDKKDRPRVPISASVFAICIEALGANRVITCDLHSGQIQGFFKIPVDNLYAIKPLSQYLHSLLDTDISLNGNVVLMSPDVGGAKRIEMYAKLMKLPHVICHKQRDHTQKSVVEKSLIVGTQNDIEGKTVIIVDDMMDTCGTMIALINSLKMFKPKECWLVCTHGILSGSAITRLHDEPLITKVICTNSLDQKVNLQSLDKLHVVDISELFAQTVECILVGKSISDLF